MDVKSVREFILDLDDISELCEILDAVKDAMLCGEAMDRENRTLKAEENLLPVDAHCFMNLAHNALLRFEQVQRDADREHAEKVASQTKPS